MFWILSSINLLICHYPAFNFTKCMREWPICWCLLTNKFACDRYIRCFINFISVFWYTRSLFDRSVIFSYIFSFSVIYHFSSNMISSLRDNPLRIRSSILSYGSSDWTEYPEFVLWSTGSCSYPPSSFV